MIPSPADAWLQGSAMDQGSAGKGPGSALLPPRSKPRQSSSPASSVDRDGAPSIGRSGVKGGRTPRQASLHGAGSSGGKFSFGKCMLSRGKTSPLSFMRVGSQHAPSGAATPNLILGGTKLASNQQQQQPLLEPAAGFQQQSESDAKDISQARDCDKARPAVQDLDLQNRASGAAIDHAIQALTSAQRHSVQRLLCSPSILCASADSLTTLAACTNLSFLILSLDAPSQACTAPAAQEGRVMPADLWLGLEKLMAALPHVVCLDVSNCLMQDRHLQVIASSCPGLRALDVSYSPHITAAGLGQLLGACANLEELDISACPAATSDELLRKLAGSCPKLCSLYIEQDAACSAEACDRGQCQVSVEALTAVAQGCKQLQVLSLAALSIAASAPATLQTFASACPQLVSLDVSGCSWPSPSDWQALAPGALPSLQTLSLSAGPSFSNHSLGAVAAACSNLTSLSIAGGGAVTDTGLLAVTGALPQLTEVTLNAPQGNSSAGVGGEGEGGLARRDCSALADSLAARGVTLIQLPQDEAVTLEVEGEAPGADLSAMDLDAAASPAPRAGAQGCEPEPMSISRSAAKPLASVREGEALPGGEGGQASWSSVMQFLTSHVSDVQMASCQKARKPQR